MRHSLLILAALCGLAFPVHAQEFPDGTMSTVRFRPAVGPGGFITVSGARILDHLDYAAGGWLEAGGPVLRQTAAQCVVENGPDCTADTPFAERLRNEELNSIPFNVFVHLTGALGVFDRAQLEIDIPFGGNTASTFDGIYRTMPDTPDSPVSTVSSRPASGFALGDPRLRGKVKIWGEPDDMLAASGEAYLTVPLARATGSDHYTGERTVQAGGDLIGELRIDKYRIALNVGAMYRPASTYLTARTGTELTYGLAAEVAPNKRIAFSLEGVGSVVLVNAYKHPGEVLFGMHVGQWNWRFHLGAGVGLSEAVGTPAGRGFLGLTYKPSVHDVDHDGISDWDDKCKTEREDRDGFEDEDGCPDPNNDGDHLPDESDQCPNEAEDMDGFEDDDGCPDPDNDDDGVPDGYDSCPHEKEDQDGDRDMDGCPDTDTDRDGIEDVDDACPNEAEDTDGLGDEDGCPDVDFDRDGIDDELDSCPEQPEVRNGIDDDDGCPEDDRDGDAIPDAQDRCPGQAETINGVSDGDGCPEGAPRLLYESGILKPTALLLFNPEGTALIQPRTFVTLDAAVEFIRRHHHTGNIAVVVHAPFGDDAALVQGETVRKYLVEAGIASNRLHVDHVVSEPARIELELVGPNVGPRPKPVQRVVPKPAQGSEPPAATDQAPANPEAAASPEAPAATEPTPPAAAPEAKL